MVKSDFFEEDYVGKITEINNKPDKFFKSASRYIASTSDNKYKNYKEKLLRFIDLLKYSDVYIGDCQIFCVNSSFSQIDFLIIYSK